MNEIKSNFYKIFDSEISWNNCYFQCCSYKINLILMTVCSEVAHSVNKIDQKDMVPLKCMISVDCTCTAI